MKWQIAGHTLTVIFILAVHVAAWGWMTIGVLRYGGDGPLSRLVAGMAAGFILFGAEIFALGHLGLLKRHVFEISALLSFAALFQLRKHLAEDLAGLRAAIRQSWRDERFLTIACFAVLAVVFVSGLRPPFEKDELGYHWLTPQLWAQQGKWVASPHRLSNGPALAEMLYTVSALWNAPTAAHWTHSIFLILLMGACGVLARCVGGSAVAAAAIVVSCPAIIMQASISYNDIAAAALAIAGLAALLSGTVTGAGERNWEKGTLLLAGICFAGAASVKPFLGIVPIIAAGLMLVADWRANGISWILFSRWIRSAQIVVLPTLLAYGIWVAHTYALIGQPIDKNGMIITSDPNDPRWVRGWAAGRIPSLKDVIELPFTPVIAAVAGRREPYGGRLDPLIVVAPLLLLVMRGQLTSRQKHAALFVLVAGTLYFFGLGPVFIKTRFHIFTWGCLAALGGTGYLHFRKEKTAKFRATILAFHLLAVFGMADGIHDIVHGLPAIISHGNWDEPPGGTLARTDKSQPAPGVFER